ncbi:DUF1616 domain-containing protein [Methanofollis sp. UBA420]|jgi:uncharacterized membrane protein|uniref:DUF1616 domain-containing protein n=1 Tax=Methanofollis sp. UBA420 TaxID=1915514 RepID=UPI00316AEAE4
MDQEGYYQRIFEGFEPRNVPKNLAIIAICTVASVLCAYLPILIAPTLFTFAMLAVAHWRRAVVPAEKRFVVPFREMAAEAKADLFPENQSRTDRTLSIILVLAILLAIATTLYVLAVPKEGEHFTEFYILGPGGKATDYPTAFAAGSNQSVIIGIGNHEYRDITYTVEVLLTSQAFDPTTNTSSLRDMEIIDRFAVTVPHNQTAEVPFPFTVERTDMNRLDFILFNETVPSDSVWGKDRLDAAYRDLHLWIGVRPPAQ